MSSQGREVELKLDLEPEEDGGSARRDDLRALLPGAGETRRLLSRYFDTPHGALRRRGLALRIRRDGEAWTQTLKANDRGGVFDRAEHEWPLDGDALDTKVLRHTPARRHLDSVAPTLATTFERTSWTIERDGASIEVSWDEGEATADGRAAPIAEIELELKSGEPAALFGLAREFAEVGRLAVGVLAKSERGFRLLDGSASGEAAKSEQVALERDATAGEAFAAVARSCLRQFRLNEAGIAARDPERLHQSRVAMRRLRSAFSIFAPVFGPHRPVAVVDELRALSGLLGTARNLDVYREGRNGSAEWAARIETERASAYDAIVARLRSGAFRVAMIDLAAFLEVGPWRDDPALAPERDRPAARFAAKLLRRRWRKLRERGLGLAEKTPEERHVIRISAKKLRYAAEFVHALVRGRKRRRRHARVVDELAELQGALGELNDLATAQAITDTLADGSEPAPAAPPDEAALLRRADKAVRSIRRSKPFWP